MSRNSRISARLFAPGALYHLLASTAFVVVFAIVPFSLYLHSGEEWALTPVLLLKLAGLGLLALLAALLGLRLLAAISRGAAVALALGLFCLGLFVLLAHVYAPVAIGPLDGEEIRSDEPLSYTLIEGALLAGAVVLFVLLWRGRGLVAASAFAGILWLVGLGYAVAAVWPTSDTAVATVDPADIPRPGACGAAGNVYHIVLDSLETDAFLAVVRGNDWEEEFDGFDLFVNNTANYAVTKNSMPSYLTGTLYHSGDLRKWRTSYPGGLFRHLDEVGFGIWTYAPFRSWNHSYADVFRFSIDIYTERVGAPQAELYDLLMVWLLAVTPNEWRNEVIPIVDDFADRAFMMLISGSRAEEEVERWDPRWHDRIPKSDFHRYASVLLLEQLALDEARRAQRCHYVYAHALLPHSPFVLDGQCRYVGQWQRRRHGVGLTKAYLQQAECGIRTVIGFLHELRRLKRYDGATVLLHADTGERGHLRNNHGSAQASKVLGIPRSWILGKAEALLMIKRPHTSHGLKIRETPTQLVDIYPTILDILDVEEPEGVHGRSVYAPSAPPREARLAFDPEEATGPNLIEVRIDDPTDLATSSLTVLGPATNPRVWRHEIKRAYRSGDPERHTTRH